MLLEPFYKGIRYTYVEDIFFMNILFVCKWNVARSQMAEAFFNRYSKKHTGKSAGTHAERFSGKKLKEIALPVVECMNILGIDLSEKVPLQLNLSIIADSHKIIIMTQKEDLPDYLMTHPNIIHWEIEDGEGKDYEFHIRMRNTIMNQVKQLVAEVDLS